MCVIYRTLLGATTLGQSGSGIDGRKGVLHIPQFPALLKPYHHIVHCHIKDTDWLGGLSAEMQSAYPTALADWATNS